MAAAQPARVSTAWVNRPVQNRLGKNWFPVCFALQRRSVPAKPPEEVKVSPTGAEPGSGPSGPTGQLALPPGGRPTQAWRTVSSGSQTGSDQ